MHVHSALPRRAHKEGKPQSDNADFIDKKITHLPEGQKWILMKKTFQYLVH